MPVLSRKANFYKFLKLMNHSGEHNFCVKIITADPVKAELQKKAKVNCPCKEFYN